MSTIKKTVINDTSFKLEVATTLFDYFMGLSGRERLEGVDGMVFRFPFKWRWKMSMRGMKFPLDFIWLRDGAIVEVVKNVYTGYVLPKSRINAVIEMPSRK